MCQKCNTNLLKNHKIVVVAYINIYILGTPFGTPTMNEPISYLSIYLRDFVFLGCNQRLCFCGAGSMQNHEKRSCSSINHKQLGSGKKAAGFDNMSRNIIAGEDERTAIAMEKIEKLAAENAVVVFSQSGCSMCDVVKRLFCSLGVGPTVYELDELQSGLSGDLEKALMRLAAAVPGTGDQSSQAAPPVPAVFVGGKLLGGLDRVMATHINGTLVPRLKEAGALWL
jgi:glutaredoxin 3